MIRKIFEKNKTKPKQKEIEKTKERKRKLKLYGRRHKTHCTIRANSSALTWKSYLF